MALLGLVSFRGIAGGNVIPHRRQRHLQPVLRRERRPHPHLHADLAGRGAGVPGALQRLFRGVRPRLGRHHQHRHAQRVQQTYGTAYWFFRNRRLNARDPYGSVNPKETRNQVGRQPGRQARQGQAVLLLQQRGPPARFSAGRLARPPAAVRRQRRSLSGTCAASAPQQCAAALQFLDRQFQVLDRTADSELASANWTGCPRRRNHVSASFNYLRWISPNGFQTQAVLNNGEGVGANGNSSVRTRYGAARMDVHSRRGADQRVSFRLVQGPPRG